MRFGFVGPSFTSKSSVVADEECINLYPETIESQSPTVGNKAYGGSSAKTLQNYYWTPGLSSFSLLPESPVRATCEANGRLFVVGGSKLIELASDGTQTVRATVNNDGKQVSIAVSNVQLLIVSGGSAYCYDLGTNIIVDVTGRLAASIPVQAEYSDGYFIVFFKDSNKFQMSAILDGTTWPGLQLNVVSVFPENIRSIIVNHRELWVFGDRHCQPYQDTGSTSIYDVIPGALIEQGCAATFSTCLADNSIFWVGKDKRGSCSVWKANGYTPQRVSTHAVEYDLGTYSDLSGIVSYAYTDGGHTFYVMYIPGASWSWVYDIAENLWHKRANWNNVWGPHWSWNHAYCFGKHLVGDWNSGNVYVMSQAYLDDNGTAIRRLRRAPTVIDEMNWIFHTEMTVDFAMGLGPQPPLVDGNGQPRQPQVSLRWSDNRGATWSNDHIRDCGFAGQFNIRAIWRRLGRSRYRVYELSMTDPIPWIIVDAYLRSSNG